MAVVIIAELFLEKIWYDKSYYKLYVNLCKKLWENNEWITESYTISCVEKNNIKQYFYNTNFKNNLELKGPFESYKLAEENAKKICNFKSVFIALCRDTFYKRQEFIEEFYKIPDSEKNEKYKIKRKIFGTIEILGHFYEMGYLDENIIHYIFISLLNNTLYEESIESVKILWDIVFKKMGVEKLKEYSILFKKEKEWCPRIKFMLDEMLFMLNEKISDEKILDENLIEKEFVYLSRKSNIETKINSINKLSDFYLRIITKIIKDSIEYPEYSNNHISTVLLLLKTSSLSFNILSKAISLVGDDMIDIKIDSPNAPKNMSSFLYNILKETDDNISIYINKNNSLYGSNDEFMEEWSFILKLVDESYINRINIINI